MKIIEGRQSGLVVSKHSSRSKGCGFKSGLIQNTRWKRVQRHTRIDPAFNSGLFENTGSQMGHIKKYI